LIAIDHTSWRSLKFRHRLFDPWHFEIVIKCTRAPKAQPKPIFYDENKYHKCYNFHHKFNCHITQYPHRQWQVCLVALTWQSCDADMELLILSMTSAQPSCGWAQFKVDYYDGPNIFQLTIYYQQCTAHIKISPHKI